MTQSRSEIKTTVVGDLKPVAPLPAGWDLDPYGLLDKPAKPKLTLDFTKEHTVYKTQDGERVPGVTTVLGMLAKPALIAWAWQQGKAGLDYKATSGKAATVGTVAHALCEAHLRGMELDRTNIAPDVLDRAETGFIKFLNWWDREQLTVVKTEHAMVSERWRVGGTADLVALRPDGTLVMPDLKTSARVYDEHLIQVATYAAMWEETQGQRIEDLCIIRIGKDDADDLEIRSVGQRSERVAAFVALLAARRALQAAGMKL